VEAARRVIGELAPSVLVFVVDSQRPETLAGFLATVRSDRRPGGCRGPIVTDCSAHQVPPSAAGQLEPYGVRVTLQPASGELQPQEFLVAFLQDLAAACLVSGRPVIGHLKCLLHAPGHAVACNLASLREGAKCSVRASSGAAPDAVPSPGSGVPSASAALKPGKRHASIWRPGLRSACRDHRCSRSRGPVPAPRATECVLVCLRL